MCPYSLETYTEIFRGYGLTLQMFFLSVSKFLQTVANDAGGKQQTI